MGKLSDVEIRIIIQKASMLQKFSEHSPAAIPDASKPEIQDLFEITDDLGIPRKFVQEAYLESTGIPVHEPLIVDNNDFNSTEVVGATRGRIDNELLGELKAQLEYHFNTMGKISHRKNKIVWKAKPVGPSKLIAASTSPEVIFEQVDGNTKISVKQSLKTINKFFTLPFATGFGAFMLFAAAVIDNPGSDGSAMIIVSALLLGFSVLAARFINRRKQKRKNRLVELTETLQHIMERKFKALAVSQDNKPEKIEIPEDESEDSLRREGPSEVNRIKDEHE